MHEGENDNRYVYIESFDEIQVFDSLDDVDKVGKIAPEEQWEIPHLPVSLISLSPQATVEATVRTHADLSAVDAQVAVGAATEAGRKSQISSEEPMRPGVMTGEGHETPSEAPANSEIERIAFRLAHLLPRSTPEEWVGDFRESVNEQRRSGQSWFRMLFVAGGRYLLVLLALARVRLQDLVMSRETKMPE